MHAVILRQLKETLAASLEEEERVLRASHHESLQQLRDKLRKEREQKEQEIADQHKSVSIPSLHCIRLFCFGSLISWSFMAFSDQRNKPAKPRVARAQEAQKFVFKNLTGCFEQNPPQCQRIWTWGTGP